VVEDLAQLPRADFPCRRNSGHGRA
jgi:hypothetical protein